MSLKNEPQRGEVFLSFFDEHDPRGRLEAHIAQTYVKEAVANIQQGRGMGGLWPQATPRLIHLVDVYVRADIQRTRPGFGWQSIAFEFQGSSLVVTGWIVDEEDCRRILDRREEALEREKRRKEEGRERWEEWEKREAVIVAERKERDWRRHIHPEDRKALINAIRIANNEVQNSFRADLGKWLEEIDDG